MATQRIEGEPQSFVSFLPERVWYLTASGTDIWCRRPYTFFFTSSDAAEAFAKRVGTEFELSAIGVERAELVSPEGLDALRRMNVTRIFIDPQHDETSGDVFGRILRIDSTQS